jgi:hypothetical protein
MFVKFHSRHLLILFVYDPANAEGHEWNFTKVLYSKLLDCHPGEGSGSMMVLSLVTRPKFVCAIHRRKCLSSIHGFGISVENIFSFFINLGSHRMAQ